MDDSAENTATKHFDASLQRKKPSMAGIGRPFAPNTLSPLVPAQHLMVSNGSGAIWELGSWRRRARVDDRRDVDGSKGLPAHHLHGREVRLRSRRGPLISWNLATGLRRKLGTKAAPGAFDQDRVGHDLEGVGHSLEGIGDRAPWRSYRQGKKRLLRHLPSGRTYRLLDARGRDLDEHVPQAFGTAGALVLLRLVGGTLERWTVPERARR